MKADQKIRVTLSLRDLAKLVAAEHPEQIERHEDYGSWRPPRDARSISDAPLFGKLAEKNWARRRRPRLVTIRPREGRTTRRRSPAVRRARSTSRGDPDPGEPSDRARGAR